MFDREREHQMKIVALNGSPGGRSSATAAMLGAFLEGAQGAGAETAAVFLCEKDIGYCRGCHSCWFDTPGRCAIEDDMAGVLHELAGADVIVLASPVYFNNVSGTLKVFMDRLTVTGNPHAGGDEGEGGPGTGAPKPVLLMMANCGFPDRSQFEVISLWINRVAAMMQADLAGEIYATQGKLLCRPAGELSPAAAEYLRALEDAGREITTAGELPGGVKTRLQADFSPG
jgi:FMN-dependent NADH-azoreductase